MLFTGFMLTESGPKVLEYNVRFGDPETEALMLLLREDVDLASILLVSFIRILSRLTRNVEANTPHRHVQRGGLILLRLQFDQDTQSLSY